jgi:asparaginyl-tRNA synthetase
MARVYIEEIKKYLDQEVTLKGWVYNIRRSGKLQFIQLRDGSEVIQCVIFRNDVGEELFEQAKRLTQESSLWVTGLVVTDERSRSATNCKYANLVSTRLPLNTRSPRKSMAPIF